MKEYYDINGIKLKEGDTIFCRKGGGTKLIEMDIVFDKDFEKLVAYKNDKYAIEIERVHMVLEPDGEDYGKFQIIN